MTILRCPDCNSTNISQPDEEGNMPVKFRCYDCGLSSENRIWSKKNE